MFIKKYYANIYAKPDGYTDISEMHPTLESLQKELKEKNWVVGNEWAFKYTDWKFSEDKSTYKKKRKKCKIAEIEYCCSKEKILRTSEYLLPEENFVEKKIDDKVMSIDISFWKDGVAKTYKVITNGSDYMERLENYLKERGLNFPESDKITVDNIELFEKEYVI